MLNNNDIFDYDDDLDKNNNSFVTFYDKFNSILYLWKKLTKKIFCFDYKITNHSIQCSQYINLEHNIYHICLASNDVIDRTKKEISRFF